MRGVEELGEVELLLLRLLGLLSHDGLVILQPPEVICICCAWHMHVTHTHTHTHTRA